MVNKNNCYSLIVDLDCLSLFSLWKNFEREFRGRREKWGRERDFFQGSSLSSWRQNHKTGKKNHIRETRTRSSPFSLPFLIMHASTVIKQGSWKEEREILSLSLSLKVFLFLSQRERERKRGEKKMSPRMENVCWNKNLSRHPFCSSALSLSNFLLSLSLFFLSLPLFPSSLFTLLQIAKG